jgi:ribonuclease R
VAKQSKREQRPDLSRDAILEYLVAHPGDTKRDLVRALNVKGPERKVLKQILSELTDEGALERGRKRSYLRPGELPDMAVLEICGEDPDGEPLARPVEWEGSGPAPLVLVLPGQDEISAPGRGERILARISRNRTDQVYEARIIKRLGASAHRALGVVKIQPGQLPRVEPVDRKSRHAFTLEAGSIAGLKDGDLVTVEPMTGRGFAGPRGRIVERFGSIREARSISLIAIHAHGIPTDFPREAILEAERSAAFSTAGRKDLRNIPLVTIDP